MQDVRGKKIFVGLSGGVDSAVSALLLKEAGAHVSGVFIKGWYPDGLPCTWADDRRDAMRVAASLHIPFHTLDASAEYKKSVIDYMLTEYGKGRTPNPDIFCNRDVKFGAFYSFAIEHGANFIATGHYARSEQGVLLRGNDAKKDQSYFLWAVHREAIHKTIFPLGTMLKSETRTHARRFHLPNATKKDSQGICFLGPLSMDDFLKSEFAVISGRAIDPAGSYVGTHEGALLHTLGERVALTNSEGGPWYVIKKDIVNNILTVSNQRRVSLIPPALTLTSTNWFNSPRTGERIAAQFRYHGPIISGIYDESVSSFMPDTALSEPIAQGQSLVLYRGNVVLGGGIIG